MAPMIGQKAPDFKMQVFDPSAPNNSVRRFATTFKAAVALRSSSIVKAIALSLLMRIFSFTMLSLIGQSLEISGQVSGYDADRIA